MSSKVRARKPREVAAAESAASTQSTPASDETVVPTPAEAAHELRESLGRVWSAARDNVRDIGQAWRRSAGHMGEETRHAARETRDSVSAAVSDIGEVSEDLMREARDLSRSVGGSLNRYVRAHPVRSLAIAAVTGAILAQAFRHRR